MSKKKVRITIFASGNGSNAAAIYDYLKEHPYVAIVSVMTNNPNAHVINRAKKWKLPYYIFDKTVLNDPETFLGILQSDKIDLIVLAGFLWLIPGYLVSAFPNKIINIHPALLPKYGGKGMYGHHVHEAVRKANESESGITIHYVNEHYDEGAIIFQASTSITAADLADDIAQKVHQLEYEHYPFQIEQIAKKVLGV